MPTIAASKNVPNPQNKQPEEPTAELNLPAPQVMHSDEPFREKFPGAQATHVDAPVKSKK